MILVNVFDLHKSFASKDLFGGISFGINEGERTGLVGPNGSGKSTLMKIIAGIASPDSGRVTKRKGLRIGFLEQTPIFDEGETILSSLLSAGADPDESYSKAFEWIGNLKLSQFGDEFLVRDLSGGWQKMVALGRELMKEPELLLLDEPTNHLDISSILWLENFLRQASFSILMVTHDRLFLQRVVNRIMDLDPRNPHHLLIAEGDYAQYLETKDLEMAALARHQKVLTNTLRRETEWLRRGAKARQTKQTARLDAAQDLKQTVQDLQKKNLHQKVKIDFGEIEKSPQKLIEAKQISKSYGSKKLFADLNVLIRRKSRLAILGDNGTGKSTLIQILLKKQDPDSGSVFHADGLKIAYFEQSRETIDPNASVLKNVCPQGDYVSFQGKFIHVRSYLDKFLFFGHQSELPAHRLSGGEKARLRLAQLMLIEAQVLVLDEPTNDLDSDTLNVLEEALNEFPGALILVTHDRFFLDSVADELLAFPKPGSSDPQLLRFSDYWQWENWFQENPSDSVTSPPFSAAAKDQGASAGPKGRLSYKEKLELENMESSILNLETEQKRLEELSQSSSASSDNKKLQEISKELAQVSVKIEEQYQRWSELSAKSLGK